MYSFQRVEGDRRSLAVCNSGQYQMTIRVGYDGPSSVNNAVPLDNEILPIIEAAPDLLNTLRRIASRDNSMLSSQHYQNMAKNVLEKWQLEVAP